MACKEWHGVPDDGFNLLGMSFDNTAILGAKRGGASRSSSGQAETVASAIKQTARGGGELGTTPVEMGIPNFERRPGDATGAESQTDFRWLMSSDLCNHRTHARCLDVCPTGALFRTRVRHCCCAARHLQWMRLLRVGLPVWGDRPRRG